ncbi:MAG: epoxyqueuosine reductase [Chloroflexota bacterium]
MSLTQDIKDFALDLGYHDVGITTAAPFTWYKQELKSRYEGYDYFIESTLKPVEGADPQGVWPEARSIISTVYDYSAQGFPPELMGKVGRLYQARCYNQTSSRTNGSRRTLFKEYLEKRGMNVMLGPQLNVPERLAAARAGVATYGRNNFAYSRGPGSFIMMTAFVVDRELEYGEATIEAPCPENCRSCIDACPTGALEPFKLNPKKCIAYNCFMTQDNFRGTNTSSHIPHGIREQMGSWIHGCDLCQEACPRNAPRLAMKFPVSSFLQLTAERFDLRKLLLLDDEYYERVVRPIMYNYIRHKRYFQRNAAIALGNSGDRSHVPCLAEALADPSPLVRGYAAWALGKLGGKEAQSAVERTFSRESDDSARNEMEAALAS